VELPFDVALAPKDPKSDEDRYCITAEPAAGVEWARQEGLCDFARRCWVPTSARDYETDADAHCFRLNPAPPYGEAVNVINGWNRRFCTNPVNAWIAEPGLPQTLTLEWDEPVACNTVHLVFDTLTRAYPSMPFNRGERASPMCVKAYDLHARVRDEWVLIGQETENFRRRRVHSFDRVFAEAVRLTVCSVWDERHSARVYEMRVYNEEGAPGH